MSSPAPQYEFNEQQNDILQRLSRDMYWVAAPLVFLGFLYAIALGVCIFNAFRQPESLIAALWVSLAMLFYLALATWIRRSAAAFERITQTKGQDIPNLMEALDNLRKLFSILALFIKAYVILMLIAVVAAGVIILARAFSGDASA